MVLVRVCLPKGEDRARIVPPANGGDVLIFPVYLQEVRLPRSVDGQVHLAQE